MQKPLARISVALLTILLAACIEPATTDAGNGAKPPPAKPSAGGGAKPPVKPPAKPGIENGGPKPPTKPPTKPPVKPPVKPGIENGPKPVADSPPINDIKSSCQVGNMRIEMLAAVNAQRSQPRNCGGQMMPAVKPLKWNSILEKVADAHSRDMAAKNYFSHNSLDGRSPFDRMAAAGYRIASAGENIAAGTPTVASAVAGWMNSPGHCRNIMDKGYTEIGAGCAIGGSYGSYFTQNFGSRY